VLSSVLSPSTKKCWFPACFESRRAHQNPCSQSSWAEIARFVGQRKLSLTADVYTHVLIDGTEVDYNAMLG
jgi:hypothetical protein